MNKIRPIVLSALSAFTLMAATPATSSESDINQLNHKIDDRVQKLEQAGLLTTSLEVEVLTADIVNEEVLNGETTVEQAVEKYQLTPTLQRYIKIKQASQIEPQDVAGSGMGMEPPQ